MSRSRMLRLVTRVVGGAGAAVAALVLVFGVIVAPEPADTAPSAVQKLYDPTDL